MSIILSSYQHCDEQQFQTPSCALYTIFPVTKLDLVIQALLLDYIIALERKYAYSLCASCYYIEFLRQNIQQKVPVCHSVLQKTYPAQPCSKRADTIRL